MDATSDRSFDVVLFGPTGVTGREVARHLGQRAGDLGLRWAVAGRDPDRIAAVLDSVGANPGAVVHADVGDPDSIADMVRSARVVANLVGPYARYGEVVYAACAAAGTHQVDLTGEMGWVADMVGRYDDAARTSGAVLVPTCGFESLPFDLLALLVAREAFARHGESVVEVDCAVRTTSSASVRGMRDLVSGGTFASLLGVVREGHGPGFTNPYLLDVADDPARGMTRPGYATGPRRHPGTGDWLAPMVPAPFINPVVVHRSASMLRAGGDPTFAAGFRYREGSAVSGMVGGGSGLAGVVAPVAAAAASATQAAVVGAARTPAPVRSRVADVLARVGPSPGEGPRPETLGAWEYRIDARATTISGAVVDAVAVAEGHPGYLSTARMVGEAALALGDPGAGPVTPGGFATPATALGLGVVERLAHAGVRMALVRP